MWLTACFLPKVFYDRLHCSLRDVVSQPHCLCYNQVASKINPYNMITYAILHKNNIWYVTTNKRTSMWTKNDLLSFFSLVNSKLSNPNISFSFINYNASSKHLFNSICLLTCKNLRFEEGLLDCCYPKLVLYLMIML